MIKQNNSTVVSVRSAVVSRFCVKHASQKWFLKMIRVTMKHDLIDAMWESM
jgi:hypothetical protein